MSSPSPEQLVEHFVAACTDKVRAALPARSELSQVLPPLVAAGAREWPGVELPLHVFIAYLAARFPLEAEIGRAIPAWRTDELYLCCACCAGDPTAIAAFEKSYVPAIRAALRRFGMDAHLVEELEQQIRVELLCGVGGRPPLLANFRGLGRLAVWLGIIARRSGRRALERQSGAADAPFHPETHMELGDPELERIKQRYRAVFERCLRRAVDELEPRQKALLRHRFADDLTLEQIGGIYRVSHTTVRRWLEDARATLLQRLRDLLIDELRLKANEVTTLLRLLPGELDLTLQTLFGRGVSLD